MHIKKLPHFNVIFIPGTVDYQSIALISLLINSDLKFRLVGNSLNQKEAALLAEVASQSNRLTSINFDSEHIIPHGTLVDLLMISETDDYFAFCDSDLFLFRSLTELQLLTALGDAAVFSSGGRIENQDDVVYAGFKGGATTISPDGLIDLATSFFCIYRRNPLEKVLKNFHVGFEQYRKSSQIPVNAKKVIEKKKLKFDMFDTGKLISVLFHELGYKKVYEDLDGLVHIGGMSGRYLQKLDLNQENIIISEEGLPTFQSSQVKEYQIRNEYEKSLKRLYGRYFYCYLKYRIGKGPRPILQAQDQRIFQTVNHLEQSISDILNQVSQNADCLNIWNSVKS